MRYCQCLLPWMKAINGVFTFPSYTGPHTRADKTIRTLQSRALLEWRNFCFCLEERHVVSSLLVCTVIKIVQMRNFSPNASFTFIDKKLFKIKFVQFLIKEPESSSVITTVLKRDSFGRFCKKVRHEVLDWNKISTATMFACWRTTIKFAAKRLSPELIVEL